MKHKQEVAMPKSPKRVSIEEAENGYTLSMYDGDKNKTMVAKDMKEVQGMMMSMMGMKMSKGEKKEMAKKKHSTSDGSMMA